MAAEEGIKKGGKPPAPQGSTDDPCKGSLVLESLKKDPASKSPVIASALSFGQWESYREISRANAVRNFKSLRYQEPDDRLVDVVTEGMRPLHLGQFIRDFRIHPLDAIEIQAWSNLLPSMRLEEIYHKVLDKTLKNSAKLKSHPENNRFNVLMNLDSIFVEVIKEAGDFNYDKDHFGFNWNGQYPYYYRPLKGWSQFIQSVKEMRLPLSSFVDGVFSELHHKGVRDKRGEGVWPLRTNRDFAPFGLKKTIYITNTNKFRSGRIRRVFQELQNIFRVL